MAVETTQTLEAANLRAAAEAASSGDRDREEMKKACAEMDRLRETVRRRQGTLNIGVPAIRELRGELPAA